MTKMLQIECEYNSELGRTVLFDANTGTVLFQATEAAFELLEDVSEVGIKIALKCGEVEAELRDEDTKYCEECDGLLPDHRYSCVYAHEPETFLIVTTKVVWTDLYNRSVHNETYECGITYVGEWEGEVKALTELVEDHYYAAHERDEFVRMFYPQTASVMED